MPGLSGSDAAYRIAVANVARADTTRAGYFVRDVVPVWINGAARSGLVQSTLRLRLVTGMEPHSASFDFKGGSGFVPAVGQSVVIGHGTTDNALFSGRIITATRTSRRADDRRPTYRCDCMGHVFELGTTRIGAWLEGRDVSAKRLVTSMLSLSSPNAATLGFSAEFVSGDLPSVQEFTLSPTEPLTNALARLFRNLDATVYVNQRRQIHAFAGTETAAGPVPSTLQVPSSTYWNFAYGLTDLSRVFSEAVVVGAGTTTLMDITVGQHASVVVESASLMVSSLFVPSSGLRVYNGSDHHLFDGTVFGTTSFGDPGDLFPAGFVSTFLAISPGANTLTAVSANVGSISPLFTGKWYQMSGQWLYTASILGVYSATANSIAYNYYVWGTGGVAPALDQAHAALPAGVSSLADITSGWHFYFLDTSITALTQRVIPAGAQVETLVFAHDTVTRDAVSSLTGSATFGQISKTFRDGRLSPDGALAVASAALARGAIDQWTVLDFDTRDEHMSIGRPVYVSVTSTAEPSGSSLAGTFTAHDITIGDFGRLTPTRGPVRTVSAGPVKKPTLWQVLQGER